MSVHSEMTSDQSNCRTERRMLYRNRTHILLILPILFSLVIPPISHSAIQIKAEVSQSYLNVGERFSYTVTISGGITLPDIIPPDFEGLQVISGPSSISSTEIINGRTSRTNTLTYSLRALREGKITIKPARAKRQSKWYDSDSINITVVSRSGSKSSRDSSSQQSHYPPQSRSLPEVFIAASADKDTIYLQEMVTVTYKLYIRVNVTSYDLAKIPRATGFWQEEFQVSARPVLNDATVRGQQYKMATIRKIGLFPTRTGSLTIQPLIADVTVQREDNRRRQRSDPFDIFGGDPFGSFFGRSRREVVSVSTEPLTMTVLSLPQEGRPANFKGDVGKYRLEVDIDKQEIAQHDALTINVTVSGDGYLKSITAPELKLPTGFEMFDPTVDQSISVSGDMMRGKKVFTYLVIPRRSGKFNLDPIEFSYFDPEKEAYQKLSSRGITLNVIPSDEDIALGGGGLTQSEITLLDQDIRFIKELVSPLVSESIQPYRSVLFYLTLAMSPFLFLLGLGAENFIERRMADPVVVRRRRAPEFNRIALKEAGKRSKRGDHKAAVDKAVEGLSEYIGAIIDAPTAGLTSEIIESGMSDLMVESTLTKDVISLLNECDMVRFGGVSLDSDKIEELLSRFAEIAGELDRIR